MQFWKVFGLDDILILDNNTITFVYGENRGQSDEVCTSTMKSDGYSTEKADNCLNMNVMMEAMCQACLTIRSLKLRATALKERMQGHDGNALIDQKDEVESFLDFICNIPPLIARYPGVREDDIPELSIPFLEEMDTGAVYEHDQLENVDPLEMSLDDLRASVDANSTIIQSLSQLYLNSQEYEKQLLDTIQALEADKNELKDQIHSSSLRMKEKEDELSSQKQTSDEVIASLSRKLDDQKRLEEKKVGDLQDQLEQFNSRAKELEVNNQEMKEEMEELEEKMNEVNQLVSEKDIRIGELEKEVGEMKMKMKMLSQSSVFPEIDENDENDENDEIEGSCCIPSLTSTAGSAIFSHPSSHFVEKTPFSKEMEGWQEMCTANQPEEIENTVDQTEFMKVCHFLLLNHYISMA